ncbi:MAG: RidA family protein [Deltaproteobacteria bacterium]|nr:RidA family protein [Deltaproteobacteria bacterium]MBW2396094.1 RidA family protein [Deltaproteobacteria bacterium]
MGIDVIVPASARKTYENWHFAPAVRHEDLIFCSGVVGQGDSAEEEFRNAWTSLGEVLSEAGVGYEDIVDSTLYIVDLAENAAAMAKVKDEFIKEPYPASTWIGITSLIIPGARAEIKVTARQKG